MIELSGKDFCRKADSLFCRDCAVCPNFQSQLVVVGNLLNTGIFNRVIYLQNWGIDTVNVNLVEGHFVDLSLVLHGFIVVFIFCDLFVLFRGNVTLTFVQNNLHTENSVWSKCCNVHAWVQNFDIRVALDGSSGNFAFTLSIDVNNLWSVTVKFCS